MITSSGGEPLPSELPIDWHNDVVPGLSDDLERHYDVLHATLYEDVTRRDIVIGGIAIRHDLNLHLPGNWTPGHEPVRYATVERWIKGDKYIARLSCLHTFGEEDHGMLMRQVTQPLPWLPLLSGIRTDSIARRAQLLPILDVSLLASKDHPNDEDFNQMRTASNEQLRTQSAGVMATRLLRPTLNRIDKAEITASGQRVARTVYGDRYGHLNKQDATSTKQLLADAHAFENSITPTAKEIATATQSIINDRLADMYLSVEILTAAIETVTTGERIRPSEPQIF